MGLISTLFLGATFATLRIILERENMLTESISTVVLAVLGVIGWMYLRDRSRNTTNRSNPGNQGADPTPESDPASTLEAPASVERWINEATRAANLTGVSRDLILAVIWQESNGDPEAIGSAGEQGLMQVTGIAAEDVGEALPEAGSSPQRQITVGAKYLSKCFDYVGGDRFKALRCYNEGPPPLTKEASETYASQVLDKLEGLQS